MGVGICGIITDCSSDAWWKRMYSSVDTGRGCWLMGDEIRGVSMSGF